MKILLFEPGTEGHRPVILEYTKKMLKSLGMQYFHINDLSYRNPYHLVKAARSNQCHAIYILTLEDNVLLAWAVSWYAWLRGIAVICIYYNYANLKQGWKSYAWRTLLATSKIGLVFVSDERLNEGVNAYSKKIAYLPDPWDPADFREYRQAEARSFLNIPSAPTVFLLFGMLDERKGADLLLAALEHLMSAQCVGSMLVVLAGKPSAAVHAEYQHLSKKYGVDFPCVLHGHHIPESSVSRYFFATDYVLNCYPRWFQVSSGGVTRALAAGRPLIVPAHGANHSLVMNKALGYAYETESSNSLADVMCHADAVRRSQRDVWDKMSANCRAEGLKRTLTEYRDWFSSGFDSLGKYDKLGARHIL